MEPNNYIISAPTSSDFAAWKACWVDYLAFYHTTREEAFIALAWERIQSDDPHEMQARIAKDRAGNLLGLVHFLYHRHGWYRNRACYLQDLYVHPQARGQGVARALIETVYDLAKKESAQQVYWMTQQENAQAKLLYDRIAQETTFVKYYQPLD